MVDARTNSEMMLFSFAFKLQIIVLTNRESGTEITSSNSLIKILNSPSIARPPGRTQLKNTIFCGQWIQIVLEYP
jgi:hypothetical protein